MRLPCETRDQILELCLVVDGPINPDPAYYEIKDPFAKTHRRPDVALLKVNKTINAEATQIFYGKNIFNLNLQLRLSVNDTNRGFAHFEASALGRFSNIIRHLRTSFDFRVLSPDDWPRNVMKSIPETTARVRHTSTKKLSSISFVRVFGKRI